MRYRPAVFCSFCLLLAVAFCIFINAGGAQGQQSDAPPKGFFSLFNGSDLTGWRGLVGDPRSRAKMTRRELDERQKQANRDMREHWFVKDGIIQFDGKGQSMCTAKDYGDFEMLVDWKIPPGGDSGIYLRGSPQVQIWEREEGSGGLYNNQKYPSKPSKNADNPPGEWNRFRILMIGDKVTVHLNGERIVDQVKMENYWERKKPIYPMGALELQNHGGPLYFRNIFVREIPRSVNVGIVDIKDHWLKVQGLARYLNDHDIPFKDLTDEVRSGAMNLDGQDALIIGSFATSEEAVSYTHLTLPTN